jgi:hypothetical protein
MKYLIFLTLFPGILFAEGWRDHEHEDQGTVVNNYITEVTEVTEVSNVYNSESGEGVAMALANNHPYSFVTKSLQISINAGMYEDNTALSIGGGMFMEKSDIFLHGSYGVEGDKQGGSIGVTLRFD